MTNDSDILNIRVTEGELDLIMDLLHEADDRVDSNGQPAFELCHDLMEQAGRATDEWDPTEIEPAPSFLVAEDDFIQRGMDAAEQAKVNRAAAVSRAQERRNERMMRGTTGTIANDPVDW
jgi:hypothetical protein